MREKRHHGRIVEWHKVPAGRAGRFKILGRMLDHPSLGKHGGYSLTSMVVKMDEKTGEIETLNSRYKLEGPETEFD